MTIYSFARRTDKQNFNFIADETLHYQIGGGLFGYAVTALKLTSRGLNPWATALSCATFAAVNNLFHMIQARFFLTRSGLTNTLIRSGSTAVAGAIAISVYTATSSWSVQTAIFANATAILSLFLVSLLTDK